jgi:hypothetical protein
MKALPVVLLVLLVSCSAPASDSQSEAQAPREPSVFDPVTIDPIERARGVEDTIFEADAERRRQIEQQSLGN